MSRVNPIVTLAQTLFVFLLAAGAGASASDEGPTRSVGLGAAASEAAPPDSSLLELSLEELMAIKVVSASKKEERLEEVPAAVYVLTAEDLRRSGVNSVPEALRLVPGLQVARLDTNKWGISARGFNDTFANKMLVLVDGQTYYTDFFSGVFWDTIDPSLANVERIEIIRGPGASIWGANAVNGIVNIITKHASETLGARAEAGIGENERSLASLRVGGRIGQRGYYRVQTQYANQDAFPGRYGDDHMRGTDAGRLSGRIDWESAGGDRWMWSGVVSEGRAESQTRSPLLTQPYSLLQVTKDPTQHHSLLGRWSRQWRDGAETSLQGHYIHFHRRLEAIENIESRQFDFEATHRQRVAKRHDFVAGMSYRVYRDHSIGSLLIELLPEHQETRLFSTFAQYQWTAGRWKLVLGDRLEKRLRVDWETEPNARLIFQPGPRHALWVAASQAARTPSRVDADAASVAKVVPPNPLFPGIPPIMVAVTGNPDLQSEHVNSFEFGYRVTPHAKLRLDLATFYNEYEDLQGFVQDPFYYKTIDGQSYGVLALHGTNSDRAITRGAELALYYRASNLWQARGGYTHYNFDQYSGSSSGDLSSLTRRGRDPSNQAFVAVNLNPTRRLETECDLRFVDRLPSLQIPSYLVGDISGRYHWTNDLATRLSLRNLFSGPHPEFRATYVYANDTAIPAGVYFAVEWSQQAGD
ncbi:MAG: TonB-dependent receptor [Candidatus Eisenbacteria bacterium]